MKVQSGVLRHPSSNRSVGGPRPAAQQSPTAKSTHVPGVSDGFRAGSTGADIGAMKGASNADALLEQRKNSNAMPKPGLEGFSGGIIRHPGSSLGSGSKLSALSSQIEDGARNFPNSGAASQGFNTNIGAGPKLGQSFGQANGGESSTELSKSSQAPVEGSASDEDVSNTESHLRISRAVQSAPKQEKASSTKKQGGVIRNPGRGRHLAQ